MFNQHTENSENQSIHPDVQKAMNAINEPEVQDILKRLSKYGLAVSVPHMHGDKGNFLPLPNDRVSFEEGLQVSFRDADDASVRSGITVGWRWNDEIKAVALCESCAGACCFKR